MYRFPEKESRSHQVTQRLIDRLSRDRPLSQFDALNAVNALRARRRISNHKTFVESARMVFGPGAYWLKGCICGGIWWFGDNCFDAALAECRRERRQVVIVEKCADCGRNIGYSRYIKCRRCIRLRHMTYDCDQNKRLINKLNREISKWRKSQQQASCESSLPAQSTA